MNTPPDHDPDKHGERGAVAGRPTSPAFGSPEFDAETRALVVPRRTETPVARLSQATLDECRRVRLMAQARRDFIVATERDANSNET